MKRATKNQPQLGLALCLAACGGLWFTHLSSTSPDGKAGLKILWAYGGADVHVKVALHTSRGDRVLFEPDGDRIPMFEEVAWSNDSRWVSVLACDGLKREIHLAYDLELMQPVRPDSIADQLRSTITRRYRLTPDALSNFGNDPIEWACSEEGSRHFHASVEIRLPSLPSP